MKNAARQWIRNTRCRWETQRQTLYGPNGEPGKTFRFKHITIPSRDFNRFHRDLQTLAKLLHQIGIVPTAATDPFFRPEKNAAWLIQKLDPVKTEFVFGGDLAVASVNLHYDHFGSAFEITRDGRPAHTACLAFGLERWVHMMLTVHGSDPADWTVPEAAPAPLREPVPA